MHRLYFITGTDTGVGKTVLTALLVRHLRRQEFNVAALKPVSSGDRADARVLRTAMDGALTLDEINPWHFRAPLAPLLAARRERQRVAQTAVLTYIRKLQKRFGLVLVEGAGGLLSPLGEDFDSRDLLTALPATPILVGPNRIGVVNQVRLTLEALPRGLATRTRVVLMSPARPDVSSPANASLLAEFFDQQSIFTLPWLGERWQSDRALADPRVRRVLAALLRA